MKIEKVFVYQLNNLFLLRGQLTLFLGVLFEQFLHEYRETVLAFL